MTSNRKAKAAARVLKASTNLSYTAARRLTPPPRDHDLGHPTRSLEELLKPYLQYTCDELVDEPIDSLGDVEVMGTFDLGEAAVYQLQVDANTMDVQIVEQYDYGALVCSVFVEATLWIQGLIAKNDTTIAAENGLVEIIDLHHDPHHALVATTVPQAVQAEFDATITAVTLGGESVDDVNFISATQLPSGARGAPSTEPAAPAQ